VVGRGAGLGAELHSLEVVKVLEAPIATIDERAVVSIALAEIEFAANEVISGARIATNVDVLNVDMGPFFNRIEQIDTLVGVVAVLSRADNRERISVFGDQDRQILNRLGRLPSLCPWTDDIIQLRVQNHKFPRDEDVGLTEERARESSQPSGANLSQCGLQFDTADVRRKPRVYKEAYDGWSRCRVYFFA
jgi:hypothetical protein